MDEKAQGKNQAGHLVHPQPLCGPRPHTEFLAEGMATGGPYECDVDPRPTLPSVSKSHSSAHGMMVCCCDVHDGVVDFSSTFLNARQGSARGYIHKRTYVPTPSLVRHCIFDSLILHVLHPIPN